MKPLSYFLTITLLLCLFPMPYGYYTIVRIIAMVAFVWLAVQKHRSGQYLLMLAFAIAAMLFQPFFKIHLGRTIWNIIDVIYALILIISCFFPRNSSK